MKILSYVYYFLVGTLPHVYHTMRNFESLSPIEVNGEQKYDVEDILNSRISNHQLQYFVHWHGHDVSEHIWESMINLLNAMEKVHEFH
jgi:hypothetical protein